MNQHLNMPAQAASSSLDEFNAMRMVCVVMTSPDVLLGVTLLTCTLCNQVVIGHACCSLHACTHHGEHICLIRHNFNSRHAIHTGMTACL